MKWFKKEKNIQFYLSELQKKIPNVSNDLEKDLNLTNLNNDILETTTFQFDFNDVFFYKSQEKVITSYIWEIERFKKIKVIFLDNNNLDINLNDFYLNNSIVNKYILDYKNNFFKNDLEMFFNFLINKDDSIPFNAFQNNFDEKNKQKINDIYNYFSIIKKRKSHKNIYKNIIFWNILLFSLISIIFGLLILFVV